MVDFKKTVPVSVPEEPKPTPIIDSTPVEESPEKLAQETLHSLDYFEFIGWGEILLNPALDVNNSKEKIIKIENFLRGQVSSQGLKNEKETYHAILSELEKSIKMSKFHDQNLRIDRIFKIIQAMEKSASEKRKMKNLIMKANEEAERKKSAFLTRFGPV